MRKISEVLNCTAMDKTTPPRKQSNSAKLWLQSLTGCGSNMQFDKDNTKPRGTDIK